MALVELKTSLPRVFGEEHSNCKFANAKGVEEAYLLKMYLQRTLRVSLPADFNKYLAKKMSGCNVIVTLTYIICRKSFTMSQCRRGVVVTKPLAHEWVITYLDIPGFGGTTSLHS